MPKHCPDGTFGLNLEKTLDVLVAQPQTVSSGSLAGKGFVRGYIAWFYHRLAHKDLSLVVQAANEQSLSMPMAAAAREAFSLARRRGFGLKDFSAMLEQHCDLHSLIRHAVIQTKFHLS